MFSRLPPPSSCASGEKEWRRVLQKCSARHVPTGFHQIYSPGLDAASASLVAERDDRRRRDPNDPEIARLNLRITASISAASRTRWVETVLKADRRVNPQRYWRFLRNLDPSRTVTNPNQPITFNNKVYTKKASIANGFCKQFTFVKKEKRDKDKSKTFKDIKINFPLDRSYCPFSESDTIDAIKANKNSPAAGPNGLTILHLKRLGPNGVRYLTHLFNLSLQAADIPAIWKCANVVAIPKPGKPADQATSFRPISLLCPEVKVLERLQLPILARSLVPSSDQHGFRHQRSTVTALLPLVTKIARGFNEPKPATRTGLLSTNGKSCRRQPFCI